MHKSPKQVVTKSNQLVRASYSITLVEQRIILMAIVEARESGKKITSNTHVAIHAKDYAERFKVTNEAAYMALKSAAETLYSREVTFYDLHPSTGKTRKRITRWVSERAETEQSGIIELIFSPAVISQITRLEKNFTSYNIEQVAGLKSVYAVRLYEMLMSWKTAGKTPFFELEKFRLQIGVCVNEYPKMVNFKARVLDLAVQQINENTDIIVSYENIKNGVKITGFEFSFKFKSAEKPKKATKEKQAKLIDYTIAGANTYALKAIQKYAPEITAEYVISFAKREKMDVADVLEQVKRDYQKAEDFSLEKTD